MLCLVYCDVSMSVKKKHIAFLAVHNVTLLDITGPYEVFAQANERMDMLGAKNSQKYILHTLSTKKDKLVRSAAGLTIRCDDSINSSDYKIDTLFIPGIPNSRNDKLEKKVSKWIAQQSTQVRRLCSVCTGTFFLAEVGVLSGKKATTHWENCDKLAHDYPLVKVENNPIFVKDGNVYTSAGISSGMDLALALVEEDFGRSFALEVAKQMVLYLKRPGNQSQYSTVLTHQTSDYKPIQTIESWIQEHLEDRLTVEMLAEQAAMSPRNFARVFVRETGATPAKYIEKIRVETACRFLVDTQLGLKEIAIKCGLSTMDNLRRLFVKYFQTTPSAYRKSFRSAF